MQAEADEGPVGRPWVAEFQRHASSGVTLAFVLAYVGVAAALAFVLGARLSAGTLRHVLGFALPTLFLFLPVRMATRDQDMGMAAHLETAPVRRRDLAWGRLVALLLAVVVAVAASWVVAAVVLQGVGAQAPAFLRSALLVGALAGLAGVLLARRAATRGWLYAALMTLPLVLAGHIVLDLAWERLARPDVADWLAAPSEAILSRLPLPLPLGGFDGFGAAVLLTLLGLAVLLLEIRRPSLYDAHAFTLRKVAVLAAMLLVVGSVLGAGLHESRVRELDRISAAVVTAGNVTGVAVLKHVAVTGNPDAGGRVTLNVTLVAPPRTTLRVRDGTVVIPALATLDAGNGTLRSHANGLTWSYDKTWEDQLPETGAQARVAFVNLSLSATFSPLPSGQALLDSAPAAPTPEFPALNLTTPLLPDVLAVDEVPWWRGMTTTGALGGGLLVAWLAWNRRL